jgi:hypothetical protein
VTTRSGCEEEDGRRRLSPTIYGGNGEKASHQVDESRGSFSLEGSVLPLDICADP